MRVVSEVVDASAVQVRMTLTASYKEWKEMIAQMPNEWPSWQMAALMRDALGQTFERVDSPKESV